MRKSTVTAFMVGAFTLTLSAEVSGVIIKTCKNTCISRNCKKGNVLSWCRNNCPTMQYRTKVCRYSVPGQLPRAPELTKQTKNLVLRNVKNLLNKRADINTWPQRNFANFNPAKPDHQHISAWAAHITKTIPGAVFSSTEAKALNDVQKRNLLLEALKTYLRGKR